jgi:hypothetical protein
MTMQATSSPNKLHHTRVKSWAWRLEKLLAFVVQRKKYIIPQLLGGPSSWCVRLGEMCSWTACSDSDLDDSPRVLRLCPTAWWRYDARIAVPRPVYEGDLTGSASSSKGLISTSMEHRSWSLTCSAEGSDLDGGWGDVRVVIWQDRRAMGTAKCGGMME